jgi:hypothetical protein
VGRGDYDWGSRERESCFSVRVQLATGLQDIVFFALVRGILDLDVQAKASIILLIKDASISVIYCFKHDYHLLSKHIFGDFPAQLRKLKFLDPIHCYIGIRSSSHELLRLLMIYPDFNIIRVRILRQVFILWLLNQDFKDSYIKWCELDLIIMVVRCSIVFCKVEIVCFR